MQGSGLSLLSAPGEREKAVTISRVLATALIPLLTSPGCRKSFSEIGVTSLINHLRSVSCLNVINKIQSSPHLKQGHDLVTAQILILIIFFIVLTASVYCRYYGTGTPTTPTPHPGRRGSWRRGRDSPPRRSPTGSRTGDRETGQQRPLGKISATVLQRQKSQLRFHITVCVLMSRNMAQWAKQGVMSIIFSCPLLKDFAYIRVFRS